MKQLGHYVVVVGTSFTKQDLESLYSLNRNYV